jgi:hypothetical protein
MFDWTFETPVRQVIGEAVGAASICWEHPEKAGVFNNQQATAIVDEVMTILYLKSFGTPMVRKETQGR